MQLGSLDDFKRPTTGSRDKGFHSGALMTAAVDDALNERKSPSSPTRRQRRTVPVLDIGGVNVDVREQTERVGEDVTLAAKDLFPVS